MKRRYAKRAALCAVLLLAGLLLGGCSGMIQERAMSGLSDVAIEAGVPAPVQDGADMTSVMATLYFLSDDGAELMPVTREIEMQAGSSRAQAVLETLLEGPAESEKGAFWPELGTSRSERFMEISGGVATVDLPAHTRTLPQEMLYAVRMAIAVTLTELRDVSYVNVLIGGREEGLDLGATMPVGTFSRLEDRQARQRYNRLNEQRMSGGGVTILTTLYFPSADGRMILPEVRSVSYAQAAPIEYLYTLLDEMGKGTTNELACASVPAPMDYIEEMPEIVRTEDGYLAIELQLGGGLDRALKEAGLTRAVYAAMLTDTLMGFVPGVEGLKIYIDSQPVTGFAQEETPDGREIKLEKTLATRGDFEGFVGAPVTLYVMGDGGLRRMQFVLPQQNAFDPRERLLGLMRCTQEEDAFALPPGLENKDILAVHMGAETIAVNLSGAFARAVSALSHRYERAAVYAMVNTLTEESRISRVVFFFDGAQSESLAGGLEMRGAFVRNPGMVVN